MNIIYSKSVQSTLVMNVSWTWYSVMSAVSQFLQLTQLFLLTILRCHVPSTYLTLLIVLIVLRDGYTITGKQTLTISAISSMYVLGHCLVAKTTLTKLWRSFTTCWLRVTCIDNCLPKIKIRPKKYPIWFTTDLICLLKEKNVSHKHYKASKSQETYAAFQERRKEFKQAKKLAYNDYLSDIQDQIIINGKRFWSFVNSRRNNRSLPTSLTYNGSSAVNSFEMAELFNTYFKSVFSEDTTDDFPECKHFMNDC